MFSSNVAVQLGRSSQTVRDFGPPSGQNKSTLCKCHRVFTLTPTTRLKERITGGKLLLIIKKTTYYGNIMRLGLTIDILFKLTIKQNMFRQLCMWGKRRPALRKI